LQEKQPHLDVAVDSSGGWLPGRKRLGPQHFFFRDVEGSLQVAKGTREAKDGIENSALPYGYASPLHPQHETQEGCKPEVRRVHKAAVGELATNATLPALPDPNLQEPGLLPRMSVGTSAEVDGDALPFAGRKTSRGGNTKNPSSDEIEQASIQTMSLGFHIFWDKQQYPAWK